MEGIAKFFAMGGYAVYVWPAVGLTVVVMVALAWQSWRSLRDAERAVAEQERVRAQPAASTWTTRSSSAIHAVSRPP